MKLKRFFSTLVLLSVFSSMAFAEYEANVNEMRFSVKASDNWGCDTFSRSVEDTAVEEIVGIAGATVKIFRLATKDEAESGDYEQFEEHENYYVPVCIAKTDEHGNFKIDSKTVKEEELEIDNYARWAFQISAPGKTTTTVTSNVGTLF